MTHSQRQKKKPLRPKRALRLPDLEQSKRTVVSSLGAASSRQSYSHAIDEFVRWYCSEPRLAFNRTVVLRYKLQLKERSLASSTINVHLAAVRRLAYEAAESGLLSPELAAGIRHVKGAKPNGHTVGNWLTADQGRLLLMNSDSASLSGKRDRAILAILLGCGLRRTELVELVVEALQTREDHWIIADLVGKGRKVRTVPMPGWVKTIVDDWVRAAGITSGRLFRRVNRYGGVWGESISSKVVWRVVKRAARRSEISPLAPHDLRRTCARLCHQAGGELEQIQFLLGHESVKTTELYLGTKQRLRDAVNDNIGIEVA